MKQNDSKAFQIGYRVDNFMDRLKKAANLIFNGDFILEASGEEIKQIKKELERY